ncbi:MAG: DUF2723 domain-containing protein [Myxococcota bacterium]|nr:DUF2723 domain-containing protein [Myxococcota bacterium]
MKPVQDIKNIGLLVCVYLVSFVIIVIGVAPGLTWLDAGELTAASSELGISHPPGMPVFAMLHKGIMALFPFGDAAFRGNLASAMLGAASCCLMFRISLRLGVRAIAAGVGSLLAILSPLFLIHATAVEVYTGLLLITLAAMDLMIVGHQSKDHRLWLLLGVILGLGVAGHHAELRLMALASTAYLCTQVKSKRFWILKVLALISGSIVILYLPIRSLQSPMRNWGDPSSLTTLWDHFWGARIRVAYGDQIGNLDFDTLTLFLEQLVLNAPLLAGLGLAGLLVTVRKKHGSFIVAVLVIDLFYSILINPMGVRDQQNGILTVACLGISAALLIDSMLSKLKHSPLLRPTLLTGICVSGLVFFPGYPRADDRGLDQLIEMTADKAPPSALLFVASDHMASGWAYKQVVECARPDLAVIVRQHIGYESSVGPVKSRLPESLSGWTPGGKLKDLDHLRSGWPILWEWASGLDAAARPNPLFPSFPVFQNRRVDGESFGNMLRLWARPHLQSSQVAIDAVAHLATDFGAYSLSKKQHNVALDYLRWATELGPLVPSRWTNLGVALNSMDQIQSAIDVTRHALDMNRGDKTAIRNLVRYLSRLKKWDEAERLVVPLVDDNPTATDYGLLGVIRANQGDLINAEVHFERALKLNSNQPEAKIGLEIIRRKKRLK